MSTKLGILAGHAVHARQEPDASLAIPFAKVGIEVELEQWDGSNKTESGLWTCKEDGSLRNNGIEFVTNGGMVGKQIHEAVSDLCKIAKQRAYSDGHPRAGIHIHLDVTDLDVDEGQLARLVSNYVLIEHAMFAYAGEWRRDCGFCISYEQGQWDFDSLGKLLYDKKLTRSKWLELVEHMPKYQAINLEPISRFGTIEFRHLPTTFEYHRVMNWIRVIVALKHSSMNPTHPTAPLETLSSIGPMNYARAILGDAWGILEPFIRPADMWRAVDNATLLMTYGGALPPIRSADWSDAIDGPSPILEAKLNKLRNRANKKIKSGEADAEF